MKQLNIICILALVLILFGCTSPTDDSLQKMGILQQKYFVTSAYSTSQSTMTDYITSLSDLKKTATGDNAKIIETEIYLAEGFAYENRAMAESIKLNYVSFNCSSTDAKAMIEYINFAFNSINSAQKDYDTLASSQKEKLRSNYGELLAGYKEKITQIKTFVETKC